MSLKPALCSDLRSLPRAGGGRGKRRRSHCWDCPDAKQWELQHQQHSGTDITLQRGKALGKVRDTWHWVLPSTQTLLPSPRHHLGPHRCVDPPAKTSSLAAHPEPLPKASLEQSREQQVDTEWPGFSHHFTAPLQGVGTGRGRQVRAHSRARAELIPGSRTTATHCHTYFQGRAVLQNQDGA